MKGYKISRIGMGTIKKDSFVSAFGTQGEDMRRLAVKALESKGMVYAAFSEDKVCVCCMTFAKSKYTGENDISFDRAECTGCFTAQGHKDAEDELRERIISEIENYTAFGFLGCRVIEFDGEEYDCYDELSGDSYGMKKILVFIVMYIIFHKVFLALMLTVVFGNTILSILGFIPEDKRHIQGSDDIAAL